MPDLTPPELQPFFDSARLALLAAVLGLLLWLWRGGRPAVVLLLALTGSGLVWWMTNAPLQRLYALGPSADRVGNLALCQVVAAGNSPLQTSQVGQLHFEPFWGLLVALLSGWSPERVLSLYPVLPLLAAWGIALAVYWGLGTRAPAEPGSLSAWERALAALFALLLWSAPLDFTGAYRDPWAMTLLLKPNHALGLVVFPLFLRLLSGVRGWRGRLLAGLVLHLLAWVFVLHMAYVAVGLVLFAAESVLARRAEWRREAMDVTVALLVNVLVVSPYLVMLLVGYPFLERLPIMTIPPASPHLLETTARAGWLFPLALWGAALLWKRGRAGRLWAAQFAAAHLVWAGYLVLSLLQLARERDEVVYWARFLSAVLAGIGAWDLAGRAARALREPWLLPPSRRAAAVIALALPFMLPYWWDPLRMDDYFPRSLAPLPPALREAGDFLRRQTEPRAVVAGDPDFARWASALGGRRVLLSRGLHRPRDFAERERVQGLLLHAAEPGEVLPASARYGVRLLAVTPAWLAANPPASLDALLARPHLRLLHLAGDPRRDFVAIFSVEAPTAGPPRSPIRDRLG